MSLYLLTYFGDTVARLANALYIKVINETIVITPAAEATPATTTGLSKIPGLLPDCSKICTLSFNPLLMIVDRFTAVEILYIAKDKSSLIVECPDVAELPVDIVVPNEVVVAPILERKAVAAVSEGEVACVSECNAAAVINLARPSSDEFVSGLSDGSMFIDETGVGDSVV